MKKGLVFAVVFCLVMLSGYGMAARLPTVGADGNQWGTILNQFLNVSHDQNGSIDVAANETARLGYTIFRNNTNHTGNNIEDVTNLTLGSSQNFTLVGSGVAQPVSLIFYVPRGEFITPALAELRYNGNEFHFNDKITSIGNIVSRQSFIGQKLG